MKELLNKPLPEIPAEIREQLDNSQITLTPLEEINEILANGLLRQEVGYRRYAMFVDSEIKPLFSLLHFPNFCYALTFQSKDAKFTHFTLKDPFP